MKISVKKLQGGECNIEVSPATSIADVKRQVAAQLNIPVDEQKLLFAGRTLADDQLVQSYPSIKDGTKLNLVVKKPEGLFEVSQKYFKKTGMSDMEATETAKKFMKIVEDKFNKMSWDDIDRLCYDCLIEEEGGDRLASLQPEHDDDLYAL